VVTESHAPVIMKRILLGTSQQHSNDEWRKMVSGSKLVRIVAEGRWHVPSPAACCAT
jgi:hypothetical protein